MNPSSQIIIALDLYARDFNANLIWTFFLQRISIVKYCDDRLPIRAVTFDLWLTLIWDSKELEEYRRLRRLINFSRFTSKISGENTRKISFNDMRLAMEQMTVLVKKKYVQGYDVSPAERGKMLFKILKVSVEQNGSEELLERAGRILSNAGYYARFPNVNPEAEPTLKLLKESLPDLKIALVSNAARSTQTYKRMLSKFGLAKYFDEYVISCEVGFLKPRREIFERALSVLKVKDPVNALHVGDLFRADVIGAVSAGMNACLYTGLWNKYAQYMNPGEHLPTGYKAETTVKEIVKLQDCQRIASEIK